MGKYHDPAREAERDMSAVRPSWAANMSTLAETDGATFRRLIARVSVLCSRPGMPHADEVESLAAAIVAGFYGDEHDVMAAAAAAVHAARTTVTAAYSRADSLDAWADVAPDFVEERARRSEWTVSLPHAWGADPEAAYATTTVDVIAAALASVQDDDARRILTDASRAYARHDGAACDVCPEAVRMGRGVSLMGILAHTREVASGSAEYQTLRRLMVRALAAVDVHGVKAEHYYPRAPLGSGPVSLTRAPRTDAPGVRERAARHLPDTDAVTVTRADGTTYATTHATVTGKAAPRTPEDRRADLIAEQVAAAPSRAVRRQERSRGNGGTGAYGPQVAVRLSRG